jgi:PAS domain-containing protein
VARPFVSYKLEGGTMLAQDIDFYRIFKMRPTEMALLTPDLEIIDMNEEFQAALGRPLEEVIGRNIFEVAPKMPEGPGGQPMWTPLETAMTSGRRETEGLMRYDVEDPDHPGVWSTTGPQWCSRYGALTVRWRSSNSARVM